MSSRLPERYHQPRGKPLTWHDLRATTATWMAVRNDRPHTIQRVLGHTTYSTTEVYIRLADAVRDGFGEVFPPLPASLVNLSGNFARIMPVAKLGAPMWLKTSPSKRGGRDSPSTVRSRAAPGWTEYRRD